MSAKAVTTRSRQTGTRVTVGLAEELGIDAEYRWATVCEDHGTFVESETQDLARATKPLDFCEGCQWLYSLREFSTDEAADLIRAFGARVIRAYCDSCGKVHEGEYAHHATYSGAMVYVVTCPVDGLSDFITREWVRIEAVKAS